MAGNKAGRGRSSGVIKENKASAGNSGRGQTNTQAGSGGRGGHRSRKGGRPEGQ